MSNVLINSFKLSALLRSEGIETIFTQTRDKIYFLINQKWLFENIASLSSASNYRQTSTCAKPRDTECDQSGLFAVKH